MDRSLSIHLNAFAQLADAEVAAVFVPTEGGPPELEAQHGLDREGLDAVEVAWSTQRVSLQRGIIVRLGVAIVWPLVLEGKLVALLYLDHAPNAFPDEPDRHYAQVVARKVLAVRRSRPSPVQVAKSVERAAERRDAEQRRQLAAVLRLVAGNVRAAAEMLGIDRDTVYGRVARFDLNLSDFRPRTQRRTKLALS